MRQCALILALLFCASASAQTPIRVACGRTTSYNDSLHQTWAADTNTQGNSFTTPTAIKNTSDSTLFQTERWNSTLTYTFALTAGNYHVNLLESENYFTASNQRVMNVKLQGLTVANAYDIFVQAKGADTAVTSGFDTTVAADGKLTLELDGITNNAKCDGIEILPLQPSQPSPLVIPMPGSGGTTGLIVTIYTFGPISNCDSQRDGVCSNAFQVCDSAVPQNCTTFTSGSVYLLRTVTLPTPQTQTVKLADVVPSP